MTPHSLLEPTHIGHLRLRNRIIMPPMLVEKATADGQVTQEAIQYYSERAHDLGLQIIEATGVSENSRLKNLLDIATDDTISGLRKLVDTIHQIGTPVAIQLVHLGGVADEAASHMKPVAPSSIMVPRYGKQVPREMNTQDIGQVVEDFTEAARRASEAGFDAVELHMAHYVLFPQFLSPLTNRRSDEYGGPLENRVRLHVEVVKSVKRELGSSHPLLCRLGVEDLVAGGLSLNEGIEAARMIERAGADVIDVSGGLVGHLHPTDKGPGFWVPQASAVKRAVNLPVVGVGGIKTPEDAERIMHSGAVDLVAVGRAMLNDAQWARKAVTSLSGEGE